MEQLTPKEELIADNENRYGYVDQLCQANKNYDEDRVSKEANETNADKNDRPYECEFCEKRFKVKAHYQTHQKRHETSQREYRCMKCHLSFLMIKHFTDHTCKKQ